MTTRLANFAARLREFILSCGATTALARTGSGRQNGVGICADFNALALKLFSLQFASNDLFRRMCESRGTKPAGVSHWKQIPAAPTGAFKEFALTCLPPPDRTKVFRSSGTSGQEPSRHFHSAASLDIYETSVWPWFRSRLLPDLGSATRDFAGLILTPPPEQAPHSSLVHMLDVVRHQLGWNDRVFVGRVDTNEAWVVDFDAAHDALVGSCNSKISLVLLGTAFSFVHLLDWMFAKMLHFALPPGSRVMETGGYKGRSRSVPKSELHGYITQRLGVPASHIVCEYGMSELSSQAYDGGSGVKCQVSGETPRNSEHATRVFHFPPWARVQIVSPETGLEAAEGEIGLIRVYDLANVFSILAVQTEDLGVRRGEGFELIGRSVLTEPRGCSLMAV